MITPISSSLKLWERCKKNTKSIKERVKRRHKSRVFWPSLAHPHLLHFILFVENWFKIYFPIWSISIYVLYITRLLIWCCLWLMLALDLRWRYLNFLTFVRYYFFFFASWPYLRIRGANEIHFKLLFMKNIQKAKLLFMFYWPVCLTGFNQFIVKFEFKFIFKMDLFEKRDLIVTCEII